MRPTATRATEIRADYDRVFDFLADVENLPRWTVFAKSVRRDGGRSVAETPQGEAEIWSEADREGGAVDYHWKIEGGHDSAPTRLRQEDGHLVYEFTVQEPPGAPEGTLEQLSETVQEELSTLKDLAEQELRA